MPGDYLDLKHSKIHCSQYLWVTYWNVYIHSNIELMTILSVESWTSLTRMLRVNVHAPATLQEDELG